MNYYDVSSTAAAAGWAIGGLAVILITLAIYIILIIGNWKVFSKAGKPGWTSIIPILNTLQLIDIAGLPAWYFIGYFIPVVDIVLMFYINIRVAKAFGKGTGFGVLLTILNPLFVLVLGFGAATYQRPADYPETWLNI